MPAEPTMLAEVPLFAALDDRERGTLSEILDTRHFAKGQAIFSHGDAGDRLYVVRRGRVRLFVDGVGGEQVTLAEHEPGEFFGELALLDAGIRTAHAVATEETEALELDRHGLLQLIRQHPDAALHLLAMIGRRLRSTDELIRTHVARNVNVEQEERMTFGDRLADRVADFGGSWAFIISFLMLVSVWIVLNLSVVVARPFDPHPFTLLNLVLAMIASLQAPVIMMSQNRQAEKDRLKAELDYRINLKAELELESLHRKVDRIVEEMRRGQRAIP